MRYLELKTLLTQWKGKICFFGAGLIGCTWAFDILKEMESPIDFYCDNNKKEGIEVREGIKTISPEMLYSFKDDVLVFITVTYKRQCVIRKQLEKNGVHRIIEADFLFLQTFVVDLIEKNDSKLNKKFKCILDDKEYISRQFEYHMGYRFDWNKPQTFNEKIQWLKLYDRNPAYTQMVDKYEVKKYITDKIGCEYTIPTLGIYYSFDEINFDMLPDQFVLKCTHDSGSVVICEDKKKLDREKAKNILDRGLKTNFYWQGREWAYKNVTPRIIAERYLDNKAEELIDYKFLCMNGEHKISFTCSNRFQGKGLCVNFYDKLWEPMPFERHYPKRNKEIKKPGNYEAMVGLAEKLSADIKFVRIDFYVVKEKIYVGEMTFYPGNGVEEFRPEEWDYKLGELLQL